MKIRVLPLLLLLLISPVFAAINIIEPQDKAIVFSDFIILKGAGQNLVKLKVNEQEIPIAPDSAFSCGLALENGKNLVKVRAMDKNKQVYEKNIRLVKLVTFDDMEKLYDGLKHWARNQVLYMATYGYIEPYPDNDFHPALPISRAELATWIAKVKQLPIETDLTKDVFFDVPKENWRAAYIKTVVEAGYLTSFSDDLFKPDDPISRRDAARVIVRCEGIKVADKISPFFQDVAQEEKGAKPIYAAQSKGFVKGVADELDIPVYDPDRALTRAEAAVLLSRFEKASASIRYLFDFDKGFGSYNFAKVDLAPEITSFSILPDILNKKQKQNIVVTISIAPRKAFYPIEKVRIDLSDVGGGAELKLLPDASREGVYNLETKVNPLDPGYKLVTVTAIDRLGWEKSADLTLIVLE